MKVRVIIISVLAQFLLLSNAFAQDPDLIMTLFSKNIGNIPWSEINKDKKFKGTPLSASENEEGTHFLYKYEIVKFNDIPLQLYLLKDKSDGSHSVKFSLLNYKNDMGLELCKTEEVTQLQAFFDRLFGTGVVHINRYQRDNFYVTMETLSWVVKNTRITMSNVYIKEKDSAQKDYAFSSVIFADVNHSREVKPITFIECNYTITHPDGTTSQTLPLILGIDNYNNRILNENYMGSVFELQNDFIVTEGKNSDLEITTRINRNSGKLTGVTTDKNKTRRYLDGSCMKQSDKRLF